MKGLVRSLRVRRRRGNYLGKPHCEDWLAGSSRGRVLPFGIEGLFKEFGAE